MKLHSFLPLWLSFFVIQIYASENYLEKYGKIKLPTKSEISIIFNWEDFRENENIYFKVTSDNLQESLNFANCAFVDESHTYDDINNHPICDYTTILKKKRAIY